MKFYLKLIYCMMEAAIDCSAWMRKAIVKGVVPRFSWVQKL